MLAATLLPSPIAAIWAGGETTCALVYLLADEALDGGGDEVGRAAHAVALDAFHLEVGLI